MAKIGVMVEFRLKPGVWQEFDTLIRDHATRTLAEEPGCERFDVLQPLTKTGAADHSCVMLCEVYRDQAAFDAHGRNPRLSRVRDAFGPLLEDRRLTICHLA